MKNNNLKISNIVFKIFSALTTYFFLFPIFIFTTYADPLRGPDLPDPKVSSFILFITKFSPPSGGPKNLIGIVISWFLPAIFGIAGFITVIMIVISGIQFIMSSGNPEAAAGAKNRLVFAVVGFVIIALAFAILQIVDKIFLGNTGIV